MRSRPRLFTFGATLVARLGALSHFGALLGADAVWIAPGQEGLCRSGGWTDADLHRFFGASVAP